MLGPDRDEVQKMIDQAVSAAYARLNGAIGVLGNHQESLIPATTTAILTANTGISNAPSITVKGGGNIRIQITGQVNALNTLQAVLTPSIVLTQNGINTIQGNLTQLALPGSTSSPSVGELVLFAESSAIAALASNTGTPFKPTPGQTIAVALDMIASATGGSVPANGLTVSLQEIF
jgi:hypothetical protein